MAQIEISDKDDKALDLIAPTYLQGGRKTAARVSWAIEQLTQRVAKDREQPEQPAKRATA